MKNRITTYQTLVDENGKIIIPCEYKKIVELPNHYFLLLSKFDFWLICDENGNLIPDVELKHDAEKNMPDSSVFVSSGLGHLCVFINNEWRFILPCGKLSENGYDEVCATVGNKDFIAAAVNGEWGFVDVYGNPKTPLAYERPHYYSNTSDLPLILKKGNTYSIFNPITGSIVKHRADYISPFKYNDNMNKYIAYAKLGSKENFLMADSSELFLEKFVDCLIINSFGVLTQNFGVTCLYGLDGHVILPNGYESITYVKKWNVFVVRRNGMYGIADINGNVLVPCNYGSKVKFNNNFAIMEKDNTYVLYKFGFGEIAIPEFVPTDKSDDVYTDFLFHVLKNYLK